MEFGFGESSESLEFLDFQNLFGIWNLFGWSLKNRVELYIDPSEIQCLIKSENVTAYDCLKVHYPIRWYAESIWKCHSVRLFESTLFNKVTCLVNSGNVTACNCLKVHYSIRWYAESIWKCHSIRLFESILPNKVIRWVNLKMSQHTTVWKYMTRWGIMLSQSHTTVWKYIIQ